MEQLIVDSSVVIKWFVPEENSDRAADLLDGYETSVFSFLMPDLLYAEMGNIVWKKCRAGVLESKDGQAVLENFLKLRFSTVSSATLLSHALRLAMTHQRTVYDSLYIALSIREACRFVTADKRLANAVAGALPNVVWLGNWQRD